jgi:lipase maturation factor 1
MLESRHRTELVSELFVRGVGFTYAIAFASLAGQIIGLIGARGVEPAAELLSRIDQNTDGLSALDFPTWLWLTGASDHALRALCIAGALCSLLVIAWKLPRLALFAAWSLYLSLCSVGGVFLSYQWDTLLLETGIVGLFVATPRSRVGIWVARALCFKLMLLSGLVKLNSGDPTWRDLSAMSYHFWTQPLPAWPAVFANALPAAIKAAMTFTSLAIELVAPLFILAPRRARLISAGALALLQVVIAATGTYGFFNMLSLLLCASLLDDDALLKLVPARPRSAAQQPANRVTAEAAPGDSSGLARTRRGLNIGLAALFLLLSLCVSIRRYVPFPAVVHESLAVLAPLRSINRYGLFAVMTTERNEIAIEGSLDGVTWRAYELPWKPGRLDVMPSFATPHMPRLDWQLWFAALSSCERQAWFHELMKRLLEGSPDVLELFANQPFPERPPRFLRTPLAQYRFAPLTAVLHGQWWARKPIGHYCPTVMLRDGELVRAK